MHGNIIHILFKSDSVLGVSILPLSMIFLLDFGTVPTVWYFLFFIFIAKLQVQVEIINASLRYICFHKRAVVIVIAW